ncbi:extracellular solute-binding protein [Cohnella sp. GCM10012308]|uniref:extracellular solute-binding protein n=1 Tax=Cohnella sp. GCM10012308 TaxID=3317329 RepID=UPI003605EB2C
MRRGKKCWRVIMVASLVAMAGCAGRSTDFSDAGLVDDGKAPVTISFWSAVMGSNPPRGIQDDPVAKQIERELGIRIDMETRPTDEKLAAILSTDDLKDIMVVNKKYIGQMKDLVLDMEPLLEKYGPDIRKNVPAEVLGTFKSIYGDGELKFLGVNIKGEAAQPEPLWNGVYLRWDYYEQLGYPEIKDSDDYLAVVAAMKALHPTNEDGKPYYGFTTWFDWGQGYNTMNFGVANQGGTYLYGGPANVVQTDVDTYETLNMYLDEDSGFWHDVRFWNRAYQMGLLDPESFTQKYDQAARKYNTGQVLASINGGMFEGSNKYLQSKQVLDKGWFGPLPMPSRQYHTFNYKFGNSNVIAIAKDAKHPERAMALINWLYSVHGAMTVANGVEGVDWVMENGAYRYTQAYENNMKDPDAALKYGYRKFLNNLGLDMNARIPGTGDPIQIALNRAVQIDELAKPENTIAKRAVSYYGVELPADILPQGVQYTNSPVYELIGFMPTIEPDEIKGMSEKINTYLNQAVPKLILARDDASFAEGKRKMMNELIGLGEKQVYDFWNEAHQAAIAKLRALEK